MRRVEVTNRFERTAYVRSAPADKKDKERPRRERGKHRLPVEPLREGERVLTTGSLELKTALENLLSEAVKPEERKAS